MTYIILLMEHPLQGQWAKKNLRQVFQTETNVPTDGLPLRECRSMSRVWRSTNDAQTKSADGSDKEKETAWTGKDMSAFTIVLMLLLLGMFAAARTDRPVLAISRTRSIGRRIHCNNVSPARIRATNLFEREKTYWNRF